MTKKNYIKIAETIKKEIHTVKDSYYHGDRPGRQIAKEQEAVYIMTRLINSLCLTLRMDNPRFDSDKFRKACRLN